MQSILCQALQVAHVEVQNAKSITQLQKFRKWRKSRGTKISLQSLMTFRVKTLFAAAQAKGEGDFKLLRKS